MTESEAPKYLTIPRFSRIPWLRHGFGTRCLALRDFRKKPEWKYFSIVWLDQIHSDDIRFIDAVPKRRLQGDVLATNVPGIILIIKTADCLPVFVIDESRRVIAAIHCGWRGTQRRIAEQTIQKLREHYNCDPSSLLAALGPCIGPACYEVGQDVRTSFRDSDLPDDIFERHSEHKDKYHLDLRAANRRQLVHQGLGEENIFDIDICTHCDPEFHSYRRDKNDVGRLFNFIGVRS